MQHFGIVLHPSNHTLSPVLYQAGFDRFGLDADFTVYNIEPGKLKNFFRAAYEKPLHGFAVSLPHKQTIVQHLDNLDVNACAIGAVNTVVNRNGQLHGYNTDWIGVLGALLERVSSEQKKPDRITHFKPDVKQLQTLHTHLSGKTALILGAGGAAMACVYALQKIGMHVLVTARTFEKSLALSEKFHCSSIPWKERKNTDAHLILNATPVGMCCIHDHESESSKKDSAQSSQPSPFPPDAWKPSQIAFDLVYQPYMTQFLLDAKAAGARIITGDLMLIHQALKQFQLLTGHSLPSSIFDQVAEAAILK